MCVCMRNTAHTIGKKGTPCDNGPYNYGNAFLKQEVAATTPDSNAKVSKRPAQCYSERYHYSLRSVKS